MWLCGVVWGCVGLCGVVWGCVGLCGVVCGSVWFHSVLYGLICFLDNFVIGKMDILHSKVEGETNG